MKPLIICAAAVALLLATPRLIQAQCLPSFEAPTFKETGSFPIELEVDDLDRDGIRDIIVVDFVSGSLSLFYGRGTGGVGNGTFINRFRILLPGGPRSVVTGDFNGDGFPDMAVPKLEIDQVTLVLSDGAGGYSSSQLPSGHKPRYAATGDFNEDGILDLVVTFSGDDHIGVYLGNGAAGVGDGSFADPLFHAAGTHPWAVISADFDGDDISDLAVTNAFSDEVMIYSGLGSGGVGDGRFSAPDVYAVGIAGGRRLDTADLNQDGQLDLVIADHPGDAIHILYGHETLGFTEPLTYDVGLGPAPVRLVDIDQDGVLDLLTSTTGDDQFHVLLAGAIRGIPDGTYSIFSFSTGVWPASLVAADFDGNGSPDLAVVNSEDNVVSILSNQCSPGPPPEMCEPELQFLSPSHFPASDQAIDVALGDFDADGVTDAAVAGLRGALSILFGRSLGSLAAAFWPPVPYAAGSEPRSVAAGDFDGDGITDLALPDFDQNRLRAFIGGGTGGLGDGTFSTHTSNVIGDLPRYAVASDLNGDGLTDIAMTLSGADRVAVLLAHGLGGYPFDPPVLYETDSHPYHLVVGDFDGDQIDDLAVTCSASDNVSILIGRGTGGVGDGTFDIGGAFEVGELPHLLATGDFNGDRVLDLAVAANAGRAVSVLFGVGDATFHQRRDYFTFDDPEGIVAADINGDGELDLAVTSPGDPTVQVLYGYDTGVFSGPFSSPTGNGAVGIVAADLAGDERPELVTVDVHDDGISVLHNCGSGPTLGPAPPLPPVVPSRAPVIVDVRDVPNDEGGSVFVTWKGSSLDIEGLEEITAYRVWRRLPAESIGAEWLVAESRPPDGIQAMRRIGPEGTPVVTFWEALTDIPAQRLAGYGYTASTTQDSMKNSNPFTAFFITALTGDRSVFYSSTVDSGYSTDDIKPNRPSGFEADYSQRGVVLSWAANREDDFDVYRLHRGTELGFEPSDENLIAVLDEAAYVDPMGTDRSVYKVAALDEHENMSGFAVAAPLERTIGGPQPLALALHGVIPNPSRAGLSVFFTLPSSAPGSLRLIDLNGRLIREFDVGHFGPGTHHIDLARGLRLANGVYWVRLSHSGRHRSAKAVLLE